MGRIGSHQPRQANLLWEKRKKPAGSNFIEIGKKIQWGKAFHSKVSNFKLKISIYSSRESINRERGFEHDPSGTVSRAVNADEGKRNTGVTTLAIKGNTNIRLRLYENSAFM